MLPIEFKLADFGIAKDITSGKNSYYKSGTPKYMGPEQFNSNSTKPINPYKCEVFSLGVTLFHLVFKVFPFSPNAYEDTECRNTNFVNNFVSSSRNQYKVKISKDLEYLL